MRLQRKPGTLEAERVPKLTEKLVREAGPGNRDPQLSRVLAIAGDRFQSDGFDDDGNYYLIVFGTNEPLRVEAGQWLVKGSDRDVYPVPHDVMVERYEPDPAATLDEKLAFYGVQREEYERVMQEAIVSSWLQERNAAAMNQLAGVLAASIPVEPQPDPQA